MCVHGYYRDLSREAMRNEVVYCGGDNAAPPEWRANVRRLIDIQSHPTLLRQSGMTAELLAYCGIRLDDLVLPRSSAVKQDSHYYLEHLIQGLCLTYDDLLLLGLTLKHLRDKRHYPLIVLHKLCAFGAEQLFAFHMSTADFENCFVSVDPRYQLLLGLNMKYWRAALEQH
jgi:hypothetical protein